MTHEDKEKNIDSIPYEETQRFKIAKDIANTYFSQVSSELSNAEQLLKSMQVPGLSAHIVDRLKQEEKKYRWPMQDEDIKDKIDEIEQRGAIALPKEPQERERWYKLLYKSASVKEGFSDDNLVMFEDALPDEALAGPRNFPEGTQLYNFERYKK